VFIDEAKTLDPVFFIPPCFELAQVWPLANDYEKLVPSPRQRIV